MEKENKQARAVIVSFRGCSVSFNRTLKACKSTARGKPEGRNPG